MATIKDVAREAGLTVGTVSRVLNDRGYISQETREKVYQVMKELNYQPSEVARSLSKQRTNIIGVIVPHIVHPYFAKLISNLERAASDQKFKILLFNSREETERELEYMEVCKSNKVCGIILCSALVSVDKFIDLNVPLITIERDLEMGTASIDCDNLQGGMMAAKYLIEKGCKNLLHFSGILNEHMPADERAEGFVRVCEKYGVLHKEVQSNAGVYVTMEYGEFIEDILSQEENKWVDGIFASSDLIAAQLIQVCRKLSIEIPSQIKIVGFDDVNIASLTTPQITTIRQPIKEMAETAISLIMKCNKGEIVPSKTILPVTLIERET